MTIREATRSDLPAIRALVEAYDDEIWRRPYPPGSWKDEYLDGWQVFVADEDEGGGLSGVAAGSIDPHGVGSVHFVYVRSVVRGRGFAKALLRTLVERLGELGADHVSLTVDTTNEVGLTVWRRLGFVEHAVEMNMPLPQLAQRLATAERPPSFGSLHVQTDDEAAVERTVRQFVPRLGGSAGSVVVPPRNGWTAVYDERCDRDRAAQRRLAEELSDRLGAVVVAVALEEQAVVRFQLFERGRMVDEYLSVPGYYGPLAKVDELSLAANPTLVARLTGADPALVRAVARTAGSPAELPLGPELLAEIAGVLGLEGATHGHAAAGSLPGAVIVSRG